MKTHQSKIEKLIFELCPNGVEFKELGEIAHILNGYSFKRISDVQKGKISDANLKFYPLKSKHEIKNYLLRENDLVMSLTGNVGRVAMLSAKDLPAGLNQRVACVRAHNSRSATCYTRRNCQNS